jgi:hypothetical protein
MTAYNFYEHRGTPDITEVFTLNYGGQQVWKAVVDGCVVHAEFNSRGAALAAIPTERARQAKLMASYIRV